MSDFLQEAERLREYRQSCIDLGLPCPVHEKITLGNWPEDWSKIPTWTEISEEVYEHFLNVLPPISFGSWDSLKTGYFQCSEPYSSERQLVRVGNKPSEDRYCWRGKYMTFTKREGTYWFLGIQFKGGFPDWKGRYHDGIHL